MNRRSFLTKSGAAAGLTVVSAKTAFGFSANEKIKLGSIGCGGRGSFVANIFKEDGGYEFTAAADYFADRLTPYANNFGVPKDKCFTGLDGYKKVIESGVDAVAVHSPPYFHPEHSAAGIAAGKHVFLAKPVAVDVPGTLSIEELGKQATSKNLVMLVDFQSRGDAIWQEGLKRTKEGAIGEFCFGECVYEADTLQAHASGTSPEDNLKNWVFFQKLSGDIITEQNIHALDIMAWALGKPVRATGTRGRKVRTNVGDTSDHYSVLFEFPGGAVNFHSRQYSAWGVQFICANRIYGTTGALFTDFGGRVMIRGTSKTAWSGGISKNLYKDGSVANVKTFRESMLNGKYENTTVPESVNTNLVTILGRTAAEKKQTVTWEEMLADKAKLEWDLTGLKA